VDELEELLTRAVKRQMVADVPVGAFHSGGIDSSTVVALMQACSDTPVRTFTIGVDDPSMNEAVLAKSVADHLETEHTELYIRESDLLCEPFADNSQIPTLLVSRLARQRVTVSLSGDGGDELFCGYDRYRQADQFWRTIRRGTPILRRFISQLGKSVPAPAWDALFRCIRPSSREMGQRIHRIARYGESGSLNELQRMILSYWVEPPVIGGAEPAWPLTEEDVPSDLPFLDQMMVHDMRTYLSDDVLTKVDRASMSVSLESRAPILDHTVVEFALRLPAEFKLREGRSKWALREVLYRHVPREMVDRPKSGFRVPVGNWLRGPLRDWAEALLDPRRLREDGYLRPEPISQTWREHLSGRYDWRVRLWNVLMFQAWLDENRQALGGTTSCATSTAVA
jgi:asparagine synthase (glutamine-hydrolysing)